MTFWQWCGIGFLALFFLYVGTRLVSAAYFKSKHDHEAMRKATR